jgi:hypothetical protein
MANQVSTFPESPVVLRVEREVEIDGVGMGVLSDGTPYLTQRGLARMCSVDPMVIRRMALGWNLQELRPREAKIKENLQQLGPVPNEPYLKVLHDGVWHYAYPDIVCMAVLEYYAFDPNSPSREQASARYRILARKSFKDFIYTQLGYSPESAVPIQWRQFHDRVMLVYGRVPAGYFCVFKEIADIIVTLIRHGAQIDHRFVPDISVGSAWARHWKSAGFDNRFGKRLTYDHNYPEYFPQASSNPQAAFCYPDAALGEFRHWIRQSYLPDKFPAYVDSKIRVGALPPSFSEAAFRAFGYETDQPLLTPRA